MTSLGVINRSIVKYGRGPFLQAFIVHAYPAESFFPIHNVASDENTLDSVLGGYSDDLCSWALYSFSNSGLGPSSVSHPLGIHPLVGMPHALAARHPA